MKMGLTRILKEKKTGLTFVLFDPISDSNELFRHDDDTGKSDIHRINRQQLLSEFDVIAEYDEEC